MSRTIPRAYVTAAWSKNPVEAEDEAKKYCRELVKAGYLPLCPILAFNGVISDEDPEVTFTKSNGKDKGTFIANCLNLIIPDSSPKGTCTLFLTTFGDSKEWANVKPEDYYKLKNQRMKEWVDYYEKNTGITIRPYIEEIAYATPPFRKRFRLRSMSAARPERSRPARPIPSSSPWRKTALPRLRTAAPVSAAGAMPA